MNKNIDIGGRLHSTATGNVVAGANEIFDDSKNKKQSDINTETYSLVNDVNERLSGLSPDQQSALSVAAKATNNEIKLGYYVCGTEGNVAAKVISDATGYVLSTGGSIKVKMTNANTANNATLNINSTGAKPLYYDGERASANNTWEAGETVEVYYDGTNFYANNVAGEGGDGVFDVSEKYPTSGVEGGNTYTLDGALAVLNANLPASKKKGGMSIKFVQSYYNKYVQARCMADEFTTDTTQWSIADEGVYVENPEFVEVRLDSAGHIIWGIQKDGNVYFGTGVPQQVINYIEEKIADLSLDEYEDIVAFLSDYLGSDTTLKAMIDGINNSISNLSNTKVDKEEGKGLIDEQVADGIHYEDNPEYVSVEIDANRNIIKATKKDGKEYFAIGIDINGYVTEHVVYNPEYIGVFIDAYGRVIMAIESDGNIYYGAGVPKQIQRCIDSINGDIESIKAFISGFDSGITLLEYLNNTYGKYVDNPEYTEVEVDNKGKILSSRNYSGEKREYVGFETPKMSIGRTKIINIDDVEERLNLSLDRAGKVISFRDKDGILHENVGIDAKKLTVQNIEFGEDAANAVGALGSIYATEKTILDEVKYNLPKYGEVDIVQETFYLTKDERVDSFDDVYVILDYEDNTYNAEHKITIGYYYIKSTLTDNGDGTYSKNSGSVKLDFYAATKVTNVSGADYVTSTLTEVVDPVTGEITYEVNAESTEVTKIVGTPDVRTWPVDKKTEHYCVVDIDFGHYLSGTFYVGVKFQGSSTLNYRERNFRFTFYKNSSYAKKDKKKIGELLRLSGFNLKANWTDATKIKELILNRLILAIQNTREYANRYPWLDDNPYCGATGTINGFPIKVKVGGAFYGIDIFSLKKDEKNYMLETAKLVDGNVVEGTGIFSSGVGGPYIDGFFRDSWSAHPEYWEDEMNDEEVLTTNNHTPADSAALIDFLTFINGDDFDKEHVPVRMDIYSWIDYFILMQVFVMVDNTSRNLVLYSGSDRTKFYAFFYDLDLAWGATSERTAYNVDILDDGVSFSKDMTPWNKLWDVYKDEIINRYSDLRKTVLSLDYINTIYKSISINIPEEDIQNQRDRWGQLVLTNDMSIWMSWFEKRLNWLDTNIFLV